MDMRPRGVTSTLEADETVSMTKILCEAAAYKPLQQGMMSV